MSISIGNDRNKEGYMYLRFIDKFLKFSNTSGNNKTSVFK